MMRSFDHVLLSMPAGRESEARAFYAGVLGMVEIDKPAALAARGGAWFEQGGIVLHLGVEEPFVPARKAHPAIVVDDLESLRVILEAAGHPCTRSDGERPGVSRVHCFDVFGNRLEFQQV
ncbi:VOC family protein [Demequina sp. NBRC 110052]|uniref:VOC family protein n=1 Tax=Demequina sp. NBRC 110052 TaxID=1570341 RepID=UPI000A02DEB6|nr:VOC family protein [Demequina sp. NBRC 110052]